MHRQLFRILYIYIAARDQKATRSGSVLERLCSRPFSADLDENGVYVIGGLVDHNQHKVDLPVLCPSLSLSLCLAYHLSLIFPYCLSSASYQRFLCLPHSHFLACDHPLSKPTIYIFRTQGLCHKLACERGIRHARLPINEVI